MHVKRLLFLFFLLPASVLAETATPAPAGPTASIEVQNRSSYTMAFAAWGNGNNCSNKVMLPPGLNINLPEPQQINLPAGKPVAVGVGIFDMQGKAPVVCDYILSFTLLPGKSYRLEYDIHNRRCFGQLFRSSEGTFQMVIPGEKEGFHEKIPEFGWDQFEPGCSGE